MVLFCAKGLLFIGFSSDGFSCLEVYVPGKVTTPGCFRVVTAMFTSGVDVKAVGVKK